MVAKRMSVDGKTISYKYERHTAQTAASYVYYATDWWFIPTKYIPGLIVR